MAGFKDEDRESSTDDDWDKSSDEEEEEKKPGKTFFKNLNASRNHNFDL